MEITFEGPAVLVRDIERSRKFYEEVLGQTVLADHGPHVAFTGKFSIWQADHAGEIMRQGPSATPDKLGQDNFELYFECKDLDAAFDKAQKAETIIHQIIEQPWGQRGFRLEDPDGHIIEIGEPLPTLINRLISQGMTPEQVTERTSIPLEFVKMAVGK